MISCPVQCVNIRSTAKLLFSPLELIRSWRELYFEAMQISCFPSNFCPPTLISIARFCLQQYWRWWLTSSRIPLVVINWNSSVRKSTVLSSPFIYWSNYLYQYYLMNIYFISQVIIYYDHYSYFVFQIVPVLVSRNSCRFIPQCIFGQSYLFLNTCLLSGTKTLPAHLVPSLPLLCSQSLFQEALVSFTEEWFLEAKIWAISTLISTGVLLLWGHLSGQS